MKAKTFLLGMLLGSIAAGATTLLSTPQSGKELRNKLKETKEDWQSQLGNVKEDFSSLTKDIRTVATESKEVVKHVTEELSQSIARWKEETAIHQQRISSEVVAMQDTLQQLEPNSPHK